MICTFAGLDGECRILKDTICDECREETCKFKKTIAEFEYAQIEAQMRLERLGLIPVVRGVGKNAHVTVVPIGGEENED